MHYVTPRSVRMPILSYPENRLNPQVHNWRGRDLARYEIVNIKCFL